MRRLAPITIAVLCVLAIGVLPASRKPSAGPAAQRFVIVAEESQVTYRVAETLFRDGNRLNIAVGTTNTIHGEITVDRSTPRNSRVGTITIDISTFRTDSTRRDRAIRERWLESARFPVAEFRPTSVEGLPASYTEGQELPLRVTGELKVRGVVRPTTFDLSVVLAGETLRGRASAAVLMTDFGFDPPSILGILRSENEVRLELRFIARPAT